MALLMIFSGALGITTALSGYLFPTIRNAEDILPDHEAKAIEEAPAAATQAEGVRASS
jgi:hypothetical protein